MSKRSYQTARAGMRRRAEEAVQGLSSSLLGTLRVQLETSLQSSGGRPGLEGAARRQKIPMSDADWQKLEQLADGFRADGLRATAGQVGAQLLHDAIARVTASRADYPEADARAGRTLLAAERVKAERGRAGARATHIGSTLSVELPNVTIAIQPVPSAGRAARGVTVSAAPGGTRWTVHSIVLRASRQV